jgi:nucleoside-diphosphate-sugar epimerase
LKVLITGATGFIGDYVIRELLKYDFEIIATSRNMDKATSKDWFAKVRYIQADLNRNRSDFFDYFGRPDLLIHLAWEGLPNYRELFHIEKNFFIHRRFIENMIRNGLKRLTVAGTCLEYGPQNGCLTEGMASLPITPYGMAKDFLQKYIAQLQKKYVFNYQWLRLFYLYGPGQRENSLAAQLEKALTNHEKIFNMTSGEQLRDYLPVAKAAEFIVKISLRDNLCGLLNCCSGRPVSVRKFVEDYVKQKGQKIILNLGYYPYPDYEPLAFWGDNARLQEALER